MSYLVTPLDIWADESRRNISPRVDTDTSQSCATHKYSKKHLYTYINSRISASTCLLRKHKILFVTESERWTRDITSPRKQADGARATRTILMRFKPKTKKVGHYQFSLSLSLSLSRRRERLFPLRNTAVTYAGRTDGRYKTQRPQLKQTNVKRTSPWNTTPNTHLKQGRPPATKRRKLARCRETEQPLRARATSGLEKGVNTEHNPNTHQTSHRHPFPR
jgi:hypothetical protein